MTETTTAVQRYLDGEAGLEETAGQLLELWKSQGWGFHVSLESLPAERMARARLLEQRFAELVRQAAHQL